MALWDKICTLIIYIGMPVVGLYHDIHESVFINVSAEDAGNVEKAANICLTPVQYLLAGKKAVKKEDGYEIQPRFDYKSDLTLKLTLSVLFVQPSFIAGSLLKGISYLSYEGQERRKKLLSALSSKKIVSQNEAFQKMGIDLSHWEKGETLTTVIHERNPGAEKHLMPEKKCYGEILKLLNENKIACWADCGTCLGAYRYAGIIPWDEDLDVAALQPDFQNVWNALKALDTGKYSVQDWSARDRPGTYIRVYVKETHAHLDIYFFTIDATNNSLTSIVSSEESAFLPESWKIREMRFKVPTPVSVVFPLKKAQFDGMEIYVPNQTKEYLQLRYGENIGPAKIYSPLTGSYEKDLSHPYWKNAHVK